MSKAYKTDLDYSIVDKPGLTVEELLEYIKKNFYTSESGAWELTQEFRLLHTVCKMENVQPSIEQYIYILCNAPRLLNEACAGAGKTTMSKYKMLLANVCHNISGKYILAIAYNTHAAEDIDRKYKVMARRVNELTRGRIHVDTDITSKTMHAWCTMWIKEYKQKFQIKDIQLLEPEVENKYMEKSVMGFLKKSGDENIMVTDNMVSSLLQLNNWIRETMQQDDPQAWNLCSAMSDLNMFSSADLISIFDMYERMKFITHKQDYQDLISFMYKLVIEPDILKRMRKVHKYLVVDEYQDITPSMLRIFRIFMEGDSALGLPRFDEGKLICIGDGDQSIYGFRGTDSDNCIRFRDMYPGAKITAMSLNRRCDSVILDYARRVIESNDNRIDKPIRGLNEGGSVSIDYYSSDTEQLRKLIEDLRKLPVLRNTCICYRNLLSSQFAVVKLLEAGININIVKGIQPFSDIYSRSIQEVLAMLQSPETPDYGKKALFKCVPRGQGFTKDNMQKVFMNHINDLKQSRRGNFVEAKKFWELDFSSWYRQNGFGEAIELLKKVHLAIRGNQSMKIIMPPVLFLLRKYYIDSLRKSVLCDKLSDEYISFIESYYSRDIPFKTFEKERAKMLESLRQNKSDGVYMTTMHGLKGLEFDNVFVIDMNDNLYPGNELKGNGLSEEQKTKLELEARRLLYVTITRARHNLKLFFSNSCPSRYIKFFVENDDLTQLYQNNESKESNKYSLGKKNDFNNDGEFIFEDDAPMPNQSNNIKEPKELNISNATINVNSKDYNAIDEEFDVDINLDELNDDDNINVDINLDELDGDDNIDVDINLDELNSDDNIEDIDINLDELNSDDNIEDIDINDFDDIAITDNTHVSSSINNMVNKALDAPNLPPIENPSSPMYKPRISAILDLLRNSREDE